MQPKRSIILLFFILLLFSNYKSNSQNSEVRIAAIDSLRHIIKQNENNLNDYSFLFTDGRVARNLRNIYGLNRNAKKITFFSEQFMSKDNKLLYLWIGSARYLNRERTIFYSFEEQFLFDNERICYYSESKFYKNKSQSDTLVSLYEIEFYIDNNSIFKTNQKGEFDEESTKYLKRKEKLTRKRKKYLEKVNK